VIIYTPSDVACGCMVSTLPTSDDFRPRAMIPDDVRVTTFTKSRLVNGHELLSALTYLAWTALELITWRQTCYIIKANDHRTQGSIRGCSSTEKHHKARLRHPSCTFDETLRNGVNFMMITSRDGRDLCSDLCRYMHGYGQRLGKGILQQKMSYR